MTHRYKGRNVENMKAADINLTPEKIVEVNEILIKHPTAGHRYFEEAVDVRLWG